MQNAPQLNDRCGTCGHAYKFHLTPDGYAKACDVEVVHTVDMNAGGWAHFPLLCGCPEFVQVTDPEEFVPEYKCGICGGEGGQHGLGCVLND